MRLGGVRNIASRRWNPSTAARHWDSRYRTHSTVSSSVDPRSRSRAHFSSSSASSSSTTRLASTCSPNRIRVVASGMSSGRELRQRRGMATVKDRSLTENHAHDSVNGSKEVLHQQSIQQHQSTLKSTNLNEHSHMDKNNDHKHELGRHHDHEHEHEHEHDHEHSHSHGLSSLLGGHSHSHGHAHSNELLKETGSAGSQGGFLSNPAARITWIGLAVNLLLAISKGIGGVYFKSQALVADALHSLSDLVSDFLTLATVNMLARVGTPDHFPMGYGKMETVGSILICMTLLFAGISVGWSSLLNLLEFVVPPNIFDVLSTIQFGHSHTHLPMDGGVEHAHSHSHAHAHAPSPVDANGGVDANALAANVVREVPNINAAWLAGASIIVKEVLYRKTMKVALQTNSKVLVANAWHHRVDSLTAAIALVSVAGGVMFNVAWMDSVGGLAVSFLIVKAGADAFKSAWYEIVDRGEPKDSETYFKVEEILADVKPKDFDVSELSVLSSGANINVFAELTTANNYTLTELNTIESRVMSALRTQDSFVRKIVISFRHADMTEKTSDDATANAANSEHNQ